MIETWADSPCHELVKHIDTTKKKAFFKPLLNSASVQAAMMVLKPGQSSSEEPEDEHPKAEQWLYVISGSGRAKTRQRALKLKAGSLLLIEKNEAHQISNTGREPMVTINFYAPPAYSADGEVKASVRA
jgi:mannose-6-phosphate isomerase-like protein (cupin superfamily)